MQHKPVQHALSNHFSLDPRRLEFIARFIIALLKVRSVNLNKIATALNGNADLESNSKRASRFLKFDFVQETIAKFVLSFVTDEKLVLCMDRTNWKFGQITINFLVIAIAFKKIALPIAWVNLEKDGNSNSKERKSILERVLKIVPTNRILGFAADREFIGKAWFETLLLCGVNPVIRIKQDTMIQHRQKTEPAWAWFNMLKPGQVFELSKARVMGIRVFVLGTLTPERELLLLVTVKRPSRALTIYGQRWDIECLFAAFKSRGFNLEDTHVTNPRKSERLFALLVLTLVWAVLVGEFVSSAQALKLKKHGSPGRSVFARGLAVLGQILHSGRSKNLVLDDVIPLLSGS